MAMEIMPTPVLKGNEAKKFHEEASANVHASVSKEELQDCISSFLNVLSTDKNHQL